MGKSTVIPFGPQHPVLPEPIHLDLELQDEKVVRAVPSIGYLFILTPKSSIFRCCRSSPRCSLILSYRSHMKVNTRFARASFHCVLTRIALRI